MARAALGIVTLTAALNCLAGSGSAAFTVNISLEAGSSASAPPGSSGSAPPGSNGICISQALSEENNAIVRVVCESGQFVSISAIPGARFVGSHGGAYTFYFGSSYRSVNVAGYGEFAHGAGSVAAFRVFGVTESEGRLDMLIEF